MTWFSVYHSAVTQLCTYFDIQEAAKWNAAIIQSCMSITYLHWHTLGLYTTTLHSTSSLLHCCLVSASSCISIPLSSYSLNAVYLRLWPGDTSTLFLPCEEAVSQKSVLPSSYEDRLAATGVVLIWQPARGVTVHLTATMVAGITN